MDFPVKTPLQLRPLLIGFRKAAGLTQAQVASRLGMAQQTYAQIEAKPEATSLHRLYHVLRILNVEIVLSRVPNATQPEASPIAHPPSVASPPIDSKRNTAKKSVMPAAKKGEGARKGDTTPTRNNKAAARTVPPLTSVLKKRENW